MTVLTKGLVERETGPGLGTGEEKLGGGHAGGSKKITRPSVSVPLGRQARKTLHNECGTGASNNIHGSMPGS